MPRATATLSRKLAEELTAPKLEIARDVNRETRERYERDPFAHCEDGHVMIEDVETGELRALVPTDQQRELTAEWIDLKLLARTGRLRFRNCHLSKSRQLGMTWWVAYLCLWVLTYHPVAGLAVFPTIGDAADSGFTTDSFFGRIRFMAEYGLGEGEEGGFPDHLRPALLFTGGNDPNVRNVHLRGAFLAADGATPTPGRGKKYRYGFLDEFAFHPFGRAAHKALSRSIPVGRLYNSTPFGEDNTYAWLLRVRPRGYRFLRLHWSGHPYYGRGLHTAAAIDDKGNVIARGLDGCKLCAGNLQGLRWNPNDPRCHRYPGKLVSPWFDAAVVEMTDEDVASELEIDFTASLTARVYPEFTDWHVAEVEIPWFEELHGHTCLSFDYGAVVSAVTICQDAPHEFRVIGEVELHDTDPDEVAAALVQELRVLGMPDKLLTIEFLERILAVGDPAGNARQQATGRPLIDEYRRHGFRILSKYNDVQTTIRATKRLMLGRPKQLVVSPRCVSFIEHAKHNRYPTDRDGNRKQDATEPLNDRHNHMMRSFAYLVAWLFPPPRRKTAAEDRMYELPRSALTRPSESGRIDPEIGYDMKL